MLDVKNATLLVIAPHPDDEVIGCGGLITKVKAAGGQVHVLFLTAGTAQDFTAGGRTSHLEERRAEIEKVARVLKLDSWRLAFEGDKYHLRLDQVAQKDLIHEIERGEEASLEATRPDILALPMVGDYNQDHRAAAVAALAACRPAPAADKFVPPLILSYESPMNAWYPVPPAPLPNFVVKLTETELQAKLDGMSAYESQVRGPGHPRHIDTLRALAVLRGSLIGEAAGEGYFCHKLTIR